MPTSVVVYETSMVMFPDNQDRVQRCLKFALKNDKEFAKGNERKQVLFILKAFRDGARRCNTPEGAFVRKPITVGWKKKK